MKRKKKVVIIILVVLATLIVIFLLGAWSMFGKQIKAISSIKCLDEEEHLYSMEVKGEYGMEELLAAGGATSDAAMGAVISDYISHGFYQMDPETANISCSTLSAVTPEGEQIYGRNFDWTGDSALVLTMKPKDGYASVSTVDLENLGYAKDYQPDSFTNKWLALAAPFVPMDGMNEKGLCVSDLEVNDCDESIDQDQGLTDVTVTVAMRLILDHCATVEEALDLLKQYDMHSSGGIMLHLSISDAEGNSVTVEYKDNEMLVMETPVLTNFWLYDGDPESHSDDSSYWRYEKLMDLNDTTGGVMSVEELTDGMESVAQKNGTWTTEWSVIYNKDALQSTLYYKGDFEKPYEFEIK